MPGWFVVEIIACEWTIYKHLEWDSALIVQGHDMAVRGSAMLMSGTPTPMLSEYFKTFFESNDGK